MLGPGLHINTRFAHRHYIPLVAPYKETQPCLNYKSSPYPERSLACDAVKHVEQLRYK